MQPKTLSKLIKRLSKVYNLVDSDALPNVMKSKKYGQVQFLLHKKYNERSLSQEAWREMVLEIVPFNASAELKMDLIQGCCFNRDITEAVHWTRHFNIPNDMLPLTLQESLQNTNDRNVDAIANGTNSNGINDSDDWDDWDATAPTATAKAICYHSIDTQRTPIIMVATREQYFEMLTYLAAQFIIAFDAEWKPISSTPDVALIQLATNERIYLLDIILMDLKPNEWNQLATNVFNNVEILKLGKPSEHNLFV